MEATREEGVWYRSNAMVYLLEWNGCWRRNRDGELVKELANKHTIQCDTEQLAIFVLARLQAMVLP